VTHTRPAAGRGRIALDEHWYVRPAARAWTCPAAPGAVLRFVRTLPGYAVTPLTGLPPLAAELGVGRVFVKDESRRLGLPAFKALGASWAIAHVVAERTGTTVTTFPDIQAAARRLTLTLVTASDGNHGRAVGHFATLLGLRAHVLVPAAVPAPAVRAIRDEGAQVTVVAGSYDDAVRNAAVVGAQPGAALVQDTAWPGYEQVPGWIVEGYSTLLHELDDQLADAGVVAADLLAVPVGVGSLAQAVVRHARRARPGPTVLGVEPQTAACVLASLLAGEPTSVPTPGTVMAGLDCGTPSALAWPYLQQGMDAAVAVSDAQATRAAADLRALGVDAGPCGAASLAGVRAAAHDPERRAGIALGADGVVVLLNTEAGTGEAAR
jgi:diaminopropionate ammonia-lyase